MRNDIYRAVCCQNINSTSNPGQAANPSIFAQNSKVTMADHLNLYVFGDQTYDIKPYLKDLLQNRDNPVLEDFLVKAYDAVRTEIFKLPHQVREDLPRFTCYHDLVLWNQTGKRCIPLDMAVTCMYQLGVFIM